MATAPAKQPGIAGQNAMSPRAVMRAMKVTPEQQRQLLRIVAAGMKVMFDEQTHQMMLDQLNQPGPIEQRLSQGIVGLMAMLWKESKGSMPPQLIIPAAMVLLAEATDFLNKAGQQVTPEQFGRANEMMIDSLLNQAGVSGDKLAAAAQARAQGGAGPAEQPAPAGAQPMMAQPAAGGVA